MKNTKRELGKDSPGEEAKIQPGVRSEDPLGIYASCEKPEQAEVLMNSPEITGLYLPFDIMETCMEQGLQKKEKELYLSLPRITRGKMPEEYRKKALTWLSMGMKGFLVRNLEAYGMLGREEGFRNTVWRCDLFIPGMMKPVRSGKTGGF